MDSFRRTNGVLMLPEALNVPIVQRQYPVRVAVSLDVALQLFAPPFRIALGDGGVDRAPVPKAAIDEDS